MRLLIITQKADRKDPVLGFFHRWIEEFARKCDSVIVIAQTEGEHKLPSNVRVLTLGKEKGVPTGAQVRKAWKLLWNFRHDYDVVFVHMTPVWINLTFPLLFVLRKPRYLWYEVKRGGWILRLAVFLSRKVFSATTDGLPFTSSKSVIVGHGIDTDQFSPGSEPRDPDLIAASGRMTPVKNYDALLRALSSLPKRMKLDIAGGTVTPSDEDERRKLESLIAELSLFDRVTMRPRRHQDVSDLFRRAVLSLHACDGGLDKVVLESMACGCPVISSSEAARHVLPPECQATKETLGEKAKAILELSPEKREQLAQSLRMIVMEKHGLTTLIERLIGEM